MNVIILDGNHRAALAVTRSLGMKGINVFVGEQTTLSLSSCSRYCKHGFTYPSPYKNPSSFIEAVRKYSKKFRNAVLLLITDITVYCTPLSKHV